jgi:carboxyl-terminal processing protease
MAQHGVLLERGIGYLAAPVFSDSNGRVLDHAIDSLRARGLRTLLLDLRHNATASLDRGVAAADLFLRPDETVVTIRGRGPGTTRVIVDRSPARWTGLGLIVLIDSSTARGSEVVAGALQDHDRALIVGAPSAGNGGDAALFPVAGGALRLTTARWYTPSGRRIDRTDPRWSEDDADDADAAGDGTDSTTGDSTGASRYRTDAGRAMPAGGAITPDVLVSGDTATPPAAARHDLRADPVIRAALDLAVHAASASDLVLHSVPPGGLQGGGADSSSRGPGTP